MSADDLDDDELPDTDTGDGTAALDDTAEVHCPWCGESVEIALDPGGGPSQDYVEDCQVCCRPWRLHVSFGRDGRAEVNVQTADDDDGGVEDY